MLQTLDLVIVLKFLKLTFVREQKCLPTFFLCYVKGSNKTLMRIICVLTNFLMDFRTKGRIYLALGIWRLLSLYNDYASTPT